MSHIYTFAFLAVKLSRRAVWVKIKVLQTQLLCIWGSFTPGAARGGGCPE